MAENTATTDDIKKDVKSAIDDGIKSINDTIGAKVEEKVKPISDDLKTLNDRVAKIEVLPMTRMGVPNINTIPKMFTFGKTTHNLEMQCEELRNKAIKDPIHYGFFANEEKAMNFSKWIIAAAKSMAATAKQDPEAYDLAMQFNELNRKTVLGEATGAYGGYAVPVEYERALVSMGRAKSFGLQNCSIINMGSMSLKVPAELTLASVAWTDEATAATAGDPTLAQVTLTAKKLDGYATASQELLDDSVFDIAGWLGEMFASAIALELDNQILNGTGSPLSGLLTAACGYSAVLGGDSTTSGSTSFSAISADDLSLAIEKIDEGYNDNLLFVWNKLVQHYLRVLKDSQKNYIYQAPAAGRPGTMWDVPYFQSSKAPSTSAVTTAFIVVGNFKYFYIGRRYGNMALAVDPYGKFLESQIRFKIMTRWGLAIAQSKAFCRLITATT